MSKLTKRKHVVREILDEYVVPTGKQEIVKVVGGRGNNLHEVVDSSGSSFLVSMPTKFRKHVWIKRGDYVIVEPIEEGDKVRAEIVHILFDDHIQHIVEEGLWPKAFECKEPAADSYMADDLLPPSDSDSEEDLGLKVVNANRRPQECDESEDDDDDEEDDGEEEDETPVTERLTLQGKGDNCIADVSSQGDTIS